MGQRAWRYPRISFEQAQGLTLACCDAGIRPPVVTSLRRPRGSRSAGSQACSAFKSTCEKPVCAIKTGGNMANPLSNQANSTFNGSQKDPRPARLARRGDKLKELQVETGGGHARKLAAARRDGQ